MKRKLPKLRTDKQAEEFVAKSDLKQYDLGGMRRMQLELKSKATRNNTQPVAPVKPHGSKKTRTG
jgi:CopG antitoxin of type II toxin-antitoxin system